MFSRWHPPAVARGVWGARLLAGRRFAGGKCVCWWEVVLPVKHFSNSAGETRTRSGALLAKRALNLLPKRALPGQTQTSGRTRITGRTHVSSPDANFRPDANCRPNEICWPERTKTKVTEFFTFGASDHDGVFSFPAALGGAEAYLFRWLASNKHLLR